LQGIRQSELVEDKDDSLPRFGEEAISDSESGLPDTVLENIVLCG